MNEIIKAMEERRSIRKFKPCFFADFPYELNEKTEDRKSTRLNSSHT